MTPHAISGTPKGRRVQQTRRRDDQRKEQQRAKVRKRIPATMTVKKREDNRSKAPSFGAPQKISGSGKGSVSLNNRGIQGGEKKKTGKRVFGEGQGRTTTRTPDDGKNS